MPEKETIPKKTGKETTPKQNPAAILITCMGIAVLLWLTNKLSNEYIGELQADINYVKIPEGNILSGKTSQQLTLQIKTKGINLLWMKLMGSKTTVDINLSKLPASRSYVLTNRLKNEIGVNPLREYELIAIHPDTLFYGLDKKFTKTVPVVFKSDLEFEKQYGMSEKVVLTPKEVKISGPRKEVSGIVRWETETVVHKKLKADKEGDVQLIKPAFAGTTIEPGKVHYNIPVEEFTEHEVEVEIRAINVPKKTNLVLYPKKVKISCQVAMKDFDKVKSSQFRAIVDFAEHTIGESKYIDIKVLQSPAFVRRIQHTPRKAEYIIYK